jgi:hypothetical protein
MEIGKEQQIRLRRFVSELLVSVNNESRGVVKIWVDKIGKPSVNAPAIADNRELMLLGYMRSHRPPVAQGIAPGEKGFGFEIAQP